MRVRGVCLRLLPRVGESRPCVEWVPSKCQPALTRQTEAQRRVDGVAQGGSEGDDEVEVERRRAKWHSRWMTPTAAGLVVREPSSKTPETHLLVQ